MDSTALSSRSRGSILLIAGCCIGAGMLGLPAVAVFPGFIPSLTAFILAWAYMASTGLLLLEVVLHYGGIHHIISITRSTLGKGATAIAWCSFLFLFYGLLTAYLSAGSEIIQSQVYLFFGIELPLNALASGIAVISALLLMLGTHVVDLCNRFLLVPLALAYLLLVGFGLPYVEGEHLAHIDWGAMSWIFPILVVSFGFHNLVPTLAIYLEDDSKAMVKAIVWGSLIPLALYIFWVAALLGAVPFDELTLSLSQGNVVVATLEKVAHTPWVSVAAQFFAFFALATSLIAIALSFIDFLTDGLNLKPTPINRAGMIFLTLLPPLWSAISWPGLFLTALSYAGGYGAVVLFGILPTLMVWKLRKLYPEQAKRLLPGGRISLVLILLFSIFVITMLALEDWMRITNSGIS